MKPGPPTRFLLATALAALLASPAAAQGAARLAAMETVRLLVALGWLSVAAFSAGALVGWHSERRGWIWGMRLAAAFEVVLAFLVPADWARVRLWLPFLIVGAAVMLGAGGLGGWLGSRARGAT